MKHLISKAALAVAMVAGAGTAMAADDGHFFVNGELGSKSFSLSTAVKDVKDKEAIGGVRFGYMWNNGPFSFGPEIGYVILGSVNGIAVAQPVDGVSPRIVTPDYLVRLKTSGWTIGGNGKFQFGDHWFVSGRGGLFRANTRTRPADITTSQVVYSHKNAKTSYYAGVGAGYDFNEHFGLGVNFDYYRAKVNLGGGDKTSGFGIKTYGVTAEYRF